MRTGGSIQGSEIFGVQLAEYVASTGKTKYASRILMGKSLEDDSLKDRERDGRITLRRMLGRQVVRAGDGWNWLRIVFNSGVVPFAFATTVLLRLSHAQPIWLPSSRVG
jgi:hypothetical protein